MVMVMVMVMIIIMIMINNNITILIRTFPTSFATEKFACHITLSVRSPGGCHIQSGRKAKHHYLFMGTKAGKF